MQIHVVFVKESQYLGTRVTTQSNCNIGYQLNSCETREMKMQKRGLTAQSGIESEVARSTSEEDVAWDRFQREIKINNTLRRDVILES